MTRGGKTELLVQRGPRLHSVCCSWYSLFSALQLRWQYPSLSWHKEMTVVFLFLGLLHGSAAGPRWSMRSCSLRRWACRICSSPFCPLSRWKHPLSSTCICYLTLFDFCREKRHATQWSTFLSQMSLWQTCSQTQPTCFVWDPSRPLGLGPTPRSRNFAPFHQVRDNHWYLISEKLTSLSDRIFTWYMDLFLCSMSCMAQAPHSQVRCRQGQACCFVKM